MIELQDICEPKTIEKTKANKSSSVEILDGDLFLSLAGLSGNAVFLCNDEWKLAFANNRFYDILSCDKTESLNKSIFNIACLKDLESISGLKDLSCDRINTFELIKDIEDEGKTVLKLNISISVIKSNQGTGNCFLGLIEDVTDKYMLEMELMSREKLDTIGYLAGGIIHDLNNNLMGIMGCAELIKNKLKDNPVLPYANKMVTMASRASELTVSTLNFAKKGSLLLRPDNLHSIISDALNIIEPALGPSYSYKYAPNAKNSAIQCDSIFIENAIINLVINARDAMYKGGEISLETSNVYIKGGDQDKETGFSVPGDYLKLKISDHGIGIKQEDLEQIFQPYFTTKRKSKGTGLGLFIVKRVIGMHGGYICLNTKEYCGSTFSLYFPIFKGDYIKKAENASKKLVKGNGTIMLVDDEDIICEVTEGLLTSLGYIVHSFNCSSDAISFYQENYSKIDAVLLDKIMPLMTGEKLFDILKFINPKIKAGIISGYSLKENETKLFKKGLKGILEKPINKKDLSIAVADILKS